MSGRLIVDAMWGGFASGIGLRKPLVDPYESPEHEDNHNNVEREAQYHYSPLISAGGEKILRVLELQPGTRQDDIVCKLQEYNLADAPPFEALSYCWGDELNVTSIDINGYDLKVPRNLRSALFHLRKTNQPRSIWADAICIDQQNLTERAHQVAIMGDIYRSAAQTVIWLGDADEHTSQAFTGCLTLAEYAAQDSSKSKIPVTRSLKGKFTSNEASAIHHLMSRPWWTRVWVVQEVVLAHDATLVCGWHAISWETFNTAVEVGLAGDAWSKVTLGIVEDDLFRSLQCFKFFKEVEKFDAVADRLLHLILELRVRQAKDAKDKIFSCLGLLHDTENELGMTPDYQSPTEHIYINAARAILTKSRTLDLLAATSIIKYESNALELPSWVPDWSISRVVATPFCKDANRELRRFTATRDSLASPQFIENGTVLVLSGYIYDEVAEIGEALRDMQELDWCSSDSEDEEQSSNTKETTWKEDLKEIKDGLEGAGRTLSQISSNLLAIVPYLSTFIHWEKLAAIEDEPSSYGRPSNEEIYWRTLCTDQMPGGRGETVRQYQEWFKSLSPIRKLLQWRVNSVSSVFKSIGFASYLGSTMKKYPEFGILLGHLTRRRLGRTKRGLLCLVPEHVGVGDEIALCRGGQAPLVMRRQHGEYRALLGEAFVLEIMYGEAFDDAACHDIKLC